MKRFAISVVAALALAACHVASPPAQNIGTGQQVDLMATARQALSCQTTISWSMVEANGGAIDQNGLYTAPSCGAPGVAIQGLYHVQATGCNRIVLIPVAVTEDVVSLTLCGVVQPSTPTSTCDANPTVPPGGQVQFFAKYVFTCGDFIFVPANPPVLP
jgi:hypothetical protein